MLFPILLKCNFSFKISKNLIMKMLFFNKNEFYPEGIDLECHCAYNLRLKNQCSLNTRFIVNLK